MPLVDLKGVFWAPPPTLSIPDNVATAGACTDHVYDVELETLATRSSVSVCGC